MDKIKIRQLEVFAYHGCNEDEKINGQKFYVDANLYTDIETPGLSDNLDDTVNYSSVCKFINKFMTENRFDLIEAVAQRLAEKILVSFPRIRALDLTINKPNAPVKLPFENIAISISRKWHKVYLSIGSNMGNKEEHLNNGIESFYDDDNCRVIQISKFIETEPYGPVEQDNFLNGCIEIETLYSPQKLLDKIHEIELEEKRVRDVHWGPRTLDIDIVFYDDKVIQTKDLTVPHIEMNKRLFVLDPLKEIAPNMIHPILKKSVNEIYNDLKPENKCEGCAGCSNK